MSNFKWPLNNSSFTYIDRIKLAAFILNKSNFWTQSKYVKEIERIFADYVGVKYSVFVSSGSTANTLLAMHLKDKVYTSAKKQIIFPSTTWSTSISPFIREGFEPIFLDISLEDFCLDLNLTEDYLKNNSDKVAAIVCVSLIGQVPDIKRLIELQEKYKVKILLDNCENTLGLYNNKNISSYFTSTTSTYFGHELQSVEGGFIFTNNMNEYEYFLMNRNHGMTRSLDVYGINSKNYKNPNVDGLFDFYSLGNNFRNTDINAFIGLLDFSRINSYVSKRIQIFNKIKSFVEDYDFIFPVSFSHRTAVPFCFPFISQNKQLVDRILNFCRSNKIETRPIISGNLLLQTCYKHYGNYQDFKNSQFLHTNGFYIGIYPTLSDKQINILKKFND
jgi:CDP-6-deoxy-D-xylo-4-hexulose-3-dehydrase